MIILIYMVKNDDKPHFSTHYELEDMQFFVDFCDLTGIIKVFRKDSDGKFRAAEWELSLEPGSVKPTLRVGEIIDPVLTESERIVDSMMGEES